MDLLKHIAFYQSWTYVSEECAIEYQQLNQPDKCEQLPPVVSIRISSHWFYQRLLRSQIWQSSYFSGQLT